MKKIFWFLVSIASLIIVLLFAGVSGQIAKEGVKYVSGQNKIPDIADAIPEIQSKAADEIRKQTPIVLDTKTTLYTAISANKQLIYMYQLKYRRQDIDKHMFIRERESILSESACNQEGMRITMEYGGSYRYSYKDIDGVFIADIIIDLSDCDQ